MATNKPADAAETKAPETVTTADAATAPEPAAPEAGADTETIDALKAQIDALNARLGAVEAKPEPAAPEAKANASGEVGRVVPGETDDFGRPWNPPKPFKQPRTYQATEKVYTDGVLYDSGDTVVTATRPSHTLVPIDNAAKVAIEASADQHGDVNISDMSATELRSFLASKGVDSGGLKDRDALLQAAQAYDDPTR